MAWVSDSFGHLRDAVGDYSRDTEETETETDLIGVQVPDRPEADSERRLQVGLGEVVTAPRFPIFHLHLSQYADKQGTTI